MATRTFDIEINGISQSVSAIDSLLSRLDELEDKLNGLGGNVDLSGMRSDLQSIREQLSGNVDDWEDISDRIEDATQQVIRLERAYDNIVNPFDEREIRDYTSQVERLEDAVEDVADASRRVGDLGNIEDSARESTQEVSRLADELDRVREASRGIDSTITVTIQGMTYEFKNVNKAINELQDRLRTLTATGQQNTREFREITDTLLNLQAVSRQTARAIDDAFSGGLQSIVSGISSLTSVAAIGQGISQLFGTENSALDESIQKFTALSLVLQGFIALQQQINTQTSGVARAFQTLSSWTKPLADGIVKVGGAATGLSKFSKYLDKLKAIDLSEQINQLTAFASVDIDANDAWGRLVDTLNEIKDELGEDIDTRSIKNAAIQFADLSMVINEIKDNFESGLIDEEQFNRAMSAVERFRENLSEDAIEAGRLTQEMQQLHILFMGTPAPLTRMQRGLLAVRAGFNMVSTAIKSLMRSTVILLAIQLAIEAISKAFEWLQKGWTWFAGDDSLVNAMDTAKAAIDATKKSVEDYTKELQKLQDTKVISNYTRLTEAVKEYNKALQETVNNQKALNLMTNETIKSLGQSLNRRNTWFTGADIRNAEDFRQQFELLQKAVEAGVDRFKALEGASAELKEKFGGNWFQELWNTASDARADFAEAQKAVISDIAYRINNLDLSKGEEEIKGFIDVLSTPMYQVSLANIEKLFPEDEYYKVLQANIQQIRDYYDQIKNMQLQAEIEAQKINDQVTKNNIAAIRNRFKREREEMKNNMELELRDATDNEELKKSIRAKYATQEAQMLQSQAKEARAAQNNIENNKIAAMKEGLDKQLAQLEQQKKQEIQSARDSEVKVNEQIAAINAKYDKLILDAKRDFYNQRKRLLAEYADYEKQIMYEISNLDIEIDKRQLSNIYKERADALGFSEETLDNVRDFYDKLRDLDNREAEIAMKDNIKQIELRQQNELDKEDAAYRQRNQQLEDYLREGLLTQKEYDDLYAKEQVLHLAKIKSIQDNADQDLLDLDRQFQETLKNNNIAAINERINAIIDAYNEIRPQMKISNLGIIDFKATRNELKLAKVEYTNLFKELATERDNLEKQFAEKKISFIDYRQAKKELDSFEKDLKQSMKDLDLTLSQLITMTIQSITQYVSQYLNVLSDMWNVYNEMKMRQIEQEQARLEEEYNMLEEAYRKQEELTKKHTDKLNDIESELKTSRGDRRAHLIEQLNAERDAMLKSLEEEQRIQAQKEENQKKQDALEKKRREQEKKNSIVQATINTFTAVTNALAVQPWFVGLALSAVALGLGMANVAMIKKQKYAKGGLLKGASHNNGGIPVGQTGIEVEGNEYVVNKRSTQKNLPLIDYINSADRKLTRDDLLAFFDRGRTNVKKTVKGKYADGGILPSIKVPEYDNTIVIQDDRPVVVEVVDIVNSADNYRQVQVLAGLTGKTV